METTTRDVLSFTGDTPHVIGSETMVRTVGVTNFDETQTTSSLFRSEGENPSVKQCSRRLRDPESFRQLSSRSDQRRTPERDLLDPYSRTGSGSYTYQVAPKSSHTKTRKVRFIFL